MFRNPHCQLFSRMLHAAKTGSRLLAKHKVSGVSPTVARGTNWPCWMLTSSRSVSGRTTLEEHPSGSRHVLKGISAQFFMFLFPWTCGKPIQSTKWLEDGCNPLISIVASPPPSPRHPPRQLQHPRQVEVDAGAGK